jgi:hypothetical protein
MDNFLTDNNNLKIQITDFLDKSLLNLDKRTSLIFKELEKIREEYASIIEKGKFNITHSQRFI